MGIVIRIDVNERERLNFKVWNDDLSNSIECCQSKILASFDVAVSDGNGKLVARPMEN